MKFRPSLFALSMLALLPAASSSFAAETPNLLYDPYSFGEPAHADLKYAWEAFKAKDYEGAERLGRILARFGDEEALFFLGGLYHQPDFARCDTQAAIGWYEKAADKGFELAYLELGKIYEMGNGAPRDAQKAFENYSNAALLGNVYAQQRLGAAYATGAGTEGNVDLAALWTKIAAKRGNVLAMADLGVMYLEGTGVEQSYDEAFSWLMAASKGPLEHVRALRALALLYEEGIGTEVDPDRANELRTRADKAEQRISVVPDREDNTNIWCEPIRTKP